MVDTLNPYQLITTSLTNFDLPAAQLAIKQQGFSVVLSQTDEKTILIQWTPDSAQAVTVGTNIIPYSLNFIPLSANEINIIKQAILDYEEELPTLLAQPQAPLLACRPLDDLKYSDQYKVGMIWITLAYLYATAQNLSKENLKDNQVFLYNYYSEDFFYPDDVLRDDDWLHYLEEQLEDADVIQATDLNGTTVHQTAIKKPNKLSDSVQRSNQPMAGIEVKKSNYKLPFLIILVLLVVGLFVLFGSH